MQKLEKKKKSYRNKKDKYHLRGNLTEYKVDQTKTLKLTTRFLISANTDLYHQYPIYF